MRSVSQAGVVLLLLICLLINAPAQTRNGGTRSNGARPAATAPAETMNGKAAPVSEMRAAIERYSVDRGSLARSYPVGMSTARRDRFKKFYSDWLASLTSYRGRILQMAAWEGPSVVLFALAAYLWHRSRRGGWHWWSTGCRWRDRT